MNFDRLTDEQLLAVRPAPEAGLAFGRFYRRHARLVVAFHIKRVRDSELAADLTSETFAQALSMRYRFSSRGDGSAVAWLFGIARFVLSHHLRRAGTTRRIEATLAIQRPALDDLALLDIAESADEGNVLVALEALPESQRQAIRGYVLDEISYDELADQLDLEASTVRKRVSRGLASLRDSLGVTA